MHCGTSLLSYVGKSCKLCEVSGEVKELCLNCQHKSELKFVTSESYWIKLTEYVDENTEMSQLLRVYVYL